MSGGCLSMAARSAAAVSPVLHRHPDVRRGSARAPGHRGDLAQRRLQVLLDVGGQRLQRRHVHHLRPGPGRPPPPAVVPRPRARSTDRARSTAPGPGRTGRCRPGTRPASCRTRSAPRSACGGPRRSPATRPPAARSARPGSGPRTRPGRRGETTRAPAHGTPGRRHSARFSLGCMFESPQDHRERRGGYRGSPGPASRALDIHDDEISRRSGQERAAGSRVDDLRLPDVHAAPGRPGRSTSRP